MTELAVLLVGLAIGIVLGIGIERVRRGGSVDISARAGPIGGAPAERTPGRATSGEGTPGGGFGGLRIGRRIVERRIETRLDPAGLTVTVDGRTYRGLGDIPDDGLRGEVRESLTALTATIHDVKMRAEIEKELRQAGIEPGPSSSSPGGAGGTG
jgi:hypothetical protein